MKSVIESLNTEEFSRIRVGIGKPEYKRDLINYVIGKIPEKEKVLLDKAYKRAALSVIELIDKGIDSAMNMYNGKE